jgi:sugar-specific transcriptional regulator TrmB
MNTHLLEKLGLTKNEAKVYLALLRFGKSLVGVIAEKTKIHRRNVYDALERLVEKGFVTFIIEDGKKYFTASNPKHLFGLIKQKEQILKSALPDLTEMYNKSPDKQDIEVYRGKAALCTLLDMHLTDKKDLYIFGSTNEIQNVLPFYFKDYEKQKDKLGIKTFIIFSSKIEKKKIDRSEFTDMRFLPKEYDSNISAVIWDNKVALQLWHPEYPMAVVIRSEDFAHSFKLFFDFMWELAKKK